MADSELETGVPCLYTDVVNWQQGHVSYLHPVFSDRAEEPAHQYSC